MQENWSNILCVKTHAMGDLLMVTPALRALRSRFPEAQITVLTGIKSAPVLENNPCVTRIWQIDENIFLKHRLYPLVRLGHLIRRAAFDLCLSFQPSMMIRLFLRLSTSGSLMGLHHGLRSIFLDEGTPWRANRSEYVGNDFLNVARLAGTGTTNHNMEFFPLENASESARERLASAGIGEYAVLCPAGGMNPRDWVPQKVWPITGFKSIRDRLIDAGLSVVVTGDERERDYCRELEGIGVLNLAGRTTVHELGAIIDGARLVVTNDSFPLHLSLAMKTPVVPIFGPSRFRALIPEAALENQCIPVVSSLECAPCYDNQPFPGCDRMDCITAISEDEVWKAVQTVLAEDLQ